MEHTIIANSRCLEDDFWKEKFKKLPIKNLLDDLSKIEPFFVNEAGREVAAKSLDHVLTMFVRLLVEDRIAVKRMKELARCVFHHKDLYVLLLTKVIPVVSKLSETKQYWNVYRLLRFLPAPSKKEHSVFYSKATTVKRQCKFSRMKRLYQAAWLDLLKQNLPDSLIVKLVPYLCDTALQYMEEPFLVGDFLFRVFKMGHVFALLSLNGIFKLIVEYNFEYPDFYGCVYALTTPAVCYSTYREQFLQLLDKFLSSTHLPKYIVAAFIKRLCRLSLLAPAAFQEPLLALIRNLLTRHENTRFLIHRDNPGTSLSDPYDENEPDMRKCGAVESSLWEIKTLQRHWLLEVARRAKFIDRNVPPMESVVRCKNDVDYFSKIMARKFGSESIKSGGDEDFKIIQDSYFNPDSNDNSNKDLKSKLRKKKDRSEADSRIAISHQAPSVTLFDSDERMV